MPLADTSARARTTNFTRFAWAVLVANLLVILWGAYVRASGSGAGCGSHWPLCNGEVVPHSPRIQTVIEFTHRAMSGVAMLAVIGLAGWSVVLFPPAHRVRKAAIYSVVFFAVEALLGAGLVLLQLVAANASGGRAFYLALHLVNTQFLLAALTLTAWFARDAAPPPSRPSTIVAVTLPVAITAWFARDAAPPPSRPSTIVAVTLPVAILVSITGVIAALGDTLFPVASLAEGMRQDLAASANFLIRLRTVHPVLAVFAAAYFLAVAVSILRAKPRPLTHPIAMAVLVLSVAQICAGAINLALLAPIGMQIVHLLLADLLWIALVLLTIESPATTQHSDLRR